MNIAHDFEKFAQELLAHAARFDQANVDEAVADGDTLRTEVLQVFVEQWLERKISPEVAARINDLTTHHHNIDADEIAPELALLLSRQ